MWVVHHREESNQNEKGPVENEVPVHSPWQRILPSVSIPWTSSFAVGREQLMRIAVILASGVVKKDLPRLNATFFRNAAW